MFVAIIQLTGSTHEHEIILAIERANMTPVKFLQNEPRDKLLNCQGYIITGGVTAQDPLLQLIREQSEIGKPVLGIGDGAKILVESGLVPGIEDHKVGMALADNLRGYCDDWVHMRLTDEYQYNAFTRHLKPKQVLRVPFAHSEGRFVIPKALLLEMQVNGLNVFQYCDEKGKVTDEFPVNPSGSVNNIAAVSNKNGNVMAMMPHPECTPEGDAIFNSMREYITEGYKQHAQPLAYYPR
jgi:phosphoribosylformylglycinamidine synthase subunit PurQ / glutaminase